MANNTVTLTGGKNSTVPSGLIYDGKKTLTITSKYNGAVSLGGTFYGLKEDKAGNPTVEAEVVANKLGIVSVESGNSNTYDITGSEKSTAIYLGTGGGTVRGGTAGDKFYGNTGKDTFVVAKGDAVGDKNGGGFGSNDLIVLEKASLSNLSFADNVKAKSVVITNGSDKMTVFKNDANIPLEINTTGDNKTFKYGVDGKKTQIGDASGKTLTITNSATKDDVFEAATILSGAKNIDASAVTKVIKIVGNGQSNNISIGSGGGTLDGGYDTAKKKATNDNLYGNTGKNAVTFYIGENGGNDNIFNYKNGDIIVIDDGGKDLISFDSKGSQKFKDGGAGKDVSFTYNGSKIAIKSNTAERIVFNVNGTLQAYGPSLEAGLSVDDKRTALVVDSNYKGDSVEAEGWTNGINVGNGSDTNALKTFAPKLNTINATATTKSMLLKAQDTIATILQSGEKGSTMVGGTGADQFQGGDGSDVYVFNVSTTTGKDVITTYGKGDLIVLKGLNDTIRDELVLDTKGAITFSNDKNKQKLSGITVKNFKNAGTPVVVLDGDNIEDGKAKVLAVRDNNGIPGPTGLNTTLKTGIETSDKFTGQYDNTNYAVGGKVNIATGVIDNSDLNEAGYGTINANDYGGAVKAINASVVSEKNLMYLDITGNASVKNTIYLPNRVSVSSSTPDLYVNVWGGTNNDTFIGHSTATKTQVTYNISAGGKDVIEGYNDGDFINLEGVTLKANAAGYVSDSRLTEKGSDVIFAFDNKNNLTIKNAAGKNIVFFDDITEKDGYNYGYTLADGLVYDSKHTAINALASIPEAVAIDLSQTSMGGSDDGRFYYAGIKTVSLAAAASDVGTFAVYGNTVANELYAAPGGTYLYGGPNAGTKAIADKLYGNTGADMFAYKKGDGADAIGNTRDGNTLFDENDVLVLGSGNATALNWDNITITDKKNVVNIVYNDDKNSKLTINKANAATPLNILFSDSMVSDRAQTSFDLFDRTVDDTNVTLTANTEYKVYGIDERKFQADASNIEKGTLNISGAGITAQSYTKYGTTNQKIVDTTNTTISVADPLTGDTDSALFAAVDVKKVSSALKNIGVTNEKLVVSLVGGVSALNVTMGAMGGTVEGGANGTKAFNDKFYASASATRGTTFVLEKATGGKDSVYNYNADNGDVLIFKDGAPKEVAFSAKSITFSYDGKKSSFTIYPPNGTTFDSTTNVKIGWPVKLEGDEEERIVVKTYYGWNAKEKDFSKYLTYLRDDQWTSPTAGTFIFEGINSLNGPQLYGTRYTLQGASIVDADANYIPDYVAIDGEGSIKFANDDATTTYVDPVYTGFHIKGNAKESSAVLNIGHTFQMNGTDYKLVQADGDTVNGFELAKADGGGGWVKLDSDSYAYFNADAFGANSKNMSVGSSYAPITINGAITDAATVGDDVLAKFKFNTANSEITIAVADSDVEISGAHVLLNKSINNISTASDKFKYASSFKVSTKAGSSEGEQVGKYKLYDADGDTVNGYELLRTDKATEANWELLTPYGTDASSKAVATLQTAGTGTWQYYNSKEDEVLKFQVAAAAGIKPADNGIPVGIAVGSINAENGEVIDTTKRTIYFSDAEFNPAHIIFDAATKTGSDTGAVHISGVKIGTQFTVNGEDFVTAEFDGDTDNGAELIKVNDSGWTYDKGAWIYDNAELIAKSKPGANVAALNFTISAAANLEADADGSPKDVKVTSDITKGYSTIDFSGLKSAHVITGEDGNNLTNGSDTSLITFGNVTTGDVQKTTRIIGFDSNTATFNLPAGAFYLADLDNDTPSNAKDKTYEFVLVNSNWKRTDTGWKYYSGGVQSVEEGTVADLEITALNLDADSSVRVGATDNGAPQGITFDGKQVVINRGEGTIKGAASYTDVTVPEVAIPAAKLLFSGETAVNAEGIHIRGAGNDSLNYMSGTEIHVLDNSEGAAAGTSNIFLLANLDRDASNGYELLTTDATSVWAFNNGMDASGKVSITDPDKKLGSWTFTSNTAIGEATALTFSVDESASLLPVDVVEEGDDGATVKAGNPRGIYVNVDANGKEATIISGDDAVKSSQLIFTDTTAAAQLFLSDTGVHLIGFEEDDTVSVRDSSNKVVANYRVKELNGAEDGFELLKVSDTDVWSLNTEDELKREWTYKGNNDGITATIAADADLNAHISGRPINFEVVAGATSTDTATIKINQDTAEANAEKLAATGLTITTNKVGSGTSIHFVVDDANFNTDTTIQVVDGTNGEESRAYYLANLDGDAANGKELLAVNGNWRFYDTAITAEKGIDGYENKIYAVGTWMYTQAGEDKNFYLALDAEAGLRPNNKNQYIAFGKTGSSTGVAAADANGAPVGVTVSGDDVDSLTITFDKERLNIQKYYESTKTTETTLFDHITFGSDTKIGAEGIHVKGFDFNNTETFKIGATDVYLAELNNNTDDGMELLKKNDFWKRTATGWVYSSDNGLHFTVNTTLKADDNGAPEGVTVTGVGSASDTIKIDTELVNNANLITFEEGTKGGSSTGVHISLSGAVNGWKDASFNFASDAGLATETHYLKELDGDSSTGYELLVANSAGWSLTNGEDADITKRTWTYTQTPAKGQNLTFSISPNAKGGLKADADTGLPIGAEVKTFTVSGSGNNATIGYDLTFGDTDGKTAEAAVLGVESNQLVFSAATTGVKGIHITGLKGSETTDGTSFAYTTDETKMFHIGDDDETTYYLADINGKRDDGFELLKNDEEWHRKENGWTFKSATAGVDLAFNIYSDTTDILLGASTTNEGKPDGISVSYNNGTLITVSSGSKIADALVFVDTDTTIDSKLHISLNAANADVKEFKFRKYGTGEAPNSDTTYYIVNADRNATNGKEFYIKDTDSDAGIWIRNETSWDYFTSGTGITSDTFKTSPNGSPLAFMVTINSGDTGYNGEDAGRQYPEGITVATDTGVITFATNSDFDASNIYLYNGHFDMSVASDTTNAGAIIFGKTHFAGNVSEGDAIRSVDPTNNKVSATYQLYNADGDTENGLELTYNGWTNYSSGNTTFYAYVQGMKASKTDNLGFALNGNAEVFAQSQTASIAGTVRTEDIGDAIFGLESATTTTKGFVISKMTSANFHVAQFSDVGKVAANTNIMIGNNTYKLKDLDNDAGNGFELTDSEGNWARITRLQLSYVGEGKEEVPFTLIASAELDKNDDFQPDGGTTVNYDDTNKTLTLNINNTVTGFAFSVGGDTDDDKAANAAKITVNYANKVWTLDGADSSGNYLLALSESEQLAADSAEAWSGYDVEDLINYDGGVTTDSELDSILEPTEIGVAETFGASDPADLLTGVATKDKSLNALTNAARHRARK